MWMGTYPTQPAKVLDNGKLLQDVLNADKEAMIGSTVLKKYGTDLPFLPKVCSSLRETHFHKLTEARSFPSKKLSPSKYIPTSTSPHAYTNRTQSSSATQTTSRRSESRCQNSRPSPASRTSRTSATSSSWSRCSASSQTSTRT